MKIKLRVLYKTTSDVLGKHCDGFNVKQLYLLHLDVNSSFNEVISMTFAKRKQSILILLPSGSVERFKAVIFLLFHFAFKRDSLLFGYFSFLIFVLSSFLLSFLPQSVINFTNLVQ